ncbi:HEPACAM family member 2 [Erpetoichthys calabaricus]|uniref:HEPACAM family member 2 n=1 Tax=Erpetoichthys calabaricus TaxID=27687 RepID=UPI0022347B34|nr:HEPACAM family member 2 [Erpetoichthys calabaricus]
MDPFQSTVYFLLYETLIVLIGSSSAFLKVPNHIIHGIKGQSLVIPVEYDVRSKVDDIQGNWEFKKLNDNHYKHVVTFRNDLFIYDMCMEFKKKFKLHPPNASLLITDLDTMEEGQYKITVNVQMKLMVTDEKTIQVTVNVPASKPVIQIIPMSEIVEDLHNVTLRCFVEFGTNIEYQWLHDGRLLQGNHRHNFYENSSVLYISPVKKEDIGDYICMVRNSISKNQSDPTAVNVFYGPYNLTVNSDKGLKTDKVFTVHAGEPTLFHCSADSNPPNTYVWIRKQNNETEKIKTGPNFLINSHDIAQKEEYMCHAYNNVTKKEEQAQFTLIIVFMDKEKMAQKEQLVSSLEVLTVISVFIILSMLVVFIWKTCHPRKVIKQIYRRPMSENRRPHRSGHEDAKEDFGIYEFIVIPGTSETAQLSSKSLSEPDSVQAQDLHTAIYDVIRHLPESSSQGLLK